MFTVSGHRGARALWPENTLAGFAGALALGVDALELDVMLTADGAVVVTHDPRLSADLVRDGSGDWITPPGPRVADLSLAHLRRFDVGRARPGGAVAIAHPRQQPVDGAMIPTLDAVLELVAHAPVRLDLELKSEDGSDRRDVEALVRGVRACITPAAAGARCIPRSFDWRMLCVWRQHEPARPLGFLTEGSSGAGLARALDAARAGDTWAPDFEGLTAADVLAAQRAGLRVEPWTVNAAGDMARLIDFGVDGFCTDAPDVAREVAAARGHPSAGRATGPGWPPP